MARTHQRQATATVVLLVRHGVTPTTGTVLPGRAAGLDLAPDGRAQADHAASRLGTLGTVRAVYSSPLERARQTAAPIARTCGVRVRVRKGLNECDFGDWTGRRLADLRKLAAWGAVQHRPSSFRFPGGESFTEMQARITAELASLAADHPGETIVAVSHADPIKAAVAHAVGTHLDLFQRIVVSPCSISALAFFGSSPMAMT